MKKYGLLIVVALTLVAVPAFAQWQMVSPVTATAKASTGAQVSCPSNACTVLVAADNAGGRKSVTMQNMGSATVYLAPNNSTCSSSTSSLIFSQYSSFTDDQGVDAWYCRGASGDATVGVTIRR